MAVPSVSPVGNSQRFAGGVFVARLKNRHAKFGALLIQLYSKIPIEDSNNSRKFA
jgi:hypothetical protein